MAASGAEELLIGIKSITNLCAFLFGVSMILWVAKIQRVRVDVRAIEGNCYDY